MADCSTAATASSEANSELYVGYLPVPRRQRSFLRMVIPSMLWLLVAIGLIAGRSQPDPGGALWEQGNLRTFTGTLAATPYPMLYADSSDPSATEVLLLVETGKHGAFPRALPFDGQHVRITGWPLHRDGRSIVELAPDAEAITADPSRRPGPMPVPAPLGRVTLHGEIVDSKCYLGAMKPGDGKTHKECATLCITGGIPPVLVARDPAGTNLFYLLSGPSGGALESAAYAYIGEPVEVSGELESGPGMPRLRVSAGDIHRR
jgi:hypothetical protein